MSGRPSRVQQRQARAADDQRHLPVYAVEEYLAECLDSILDQAPPGIEVIAVDDASPDECGRVLDDRAARDPRLRVVHLADNAGPGHARNMGLDQAAGEYVWFVDADDLLADGALAAIAAHLEQDRPDVLLIDYEDLFPGGRTAPGPGHCPAPRRAQRHIHPGRAAAGDPPHDDVLEQGDPP